MPAVDKPAVAALYSAVAANPSAITSSSSAGLLPSAQKKSPQDQRTAEISDVKSLDLSSRCHCWGWVRKS